MRLYLSITLLLLNLMAWAYILYHSLSTETDYAPRNAPATSIEQPYSDKSECSTVNSPPIMGNATKTNLVHSKDTANVAPKTTVSTDLPLKSREKIIPIPNLAQYLAGLGLHNAQATDSSLRVDLRYATPDNFVGQTLYADLSACYVLPRTAQMLAAAQKKLHAQHPNYNILLLDCARPRRVQQQLWNAVKHLPNMRRYVAPPQYGSLHNFGAAIDVTIVDAQGQALDMGTPYDYMGELAQPRHQQRFLKSGQLTQDQVNNRLLLRRIMREAGFKAIESEWWHFNACTINQAKQKYRAIE
jgi:D-alanyl-D-alanine dipeptidase